MAKKKLDRRSVLEQMKEEEGREVAAFLTALDRPMAPEEVSSDR